MQQRVVIFMGPQGSGKGTQAKILKQYLQEHDPSNQVFTVETGQHFREVMSGESYTAKKIRESINRGDLQPDWLPSWLFVNSFVDSYEPDMHVIIDGIPRTTGQSDRIDEVFDYYGIDKVSVILLEVSQRVSLDRMLSRGRADDTEEAIIHRLEQYQAETCPVISYLQDKPRYQVHKVDGGQHIEKVTSDIFDALEID